MSDELIRNAIYEGNLELIKACIKNGYDIHKNNYVLGWASNNGYLEIVKLLIKSGSSINNICDNHYVLLSTLLNCHFEIFKLLCEQKLNNNLNGYKSLGFYLKNGNIRIFKYMSITPKIQDIDDIYDLKDREFYDYILELIS